MSNKNAVRTTLAGLGVAGGAVVAAAVIPVGTANAKIVGIDGESGTYTSDIITAPATVSNPSPAVYIFDNSGSVYTTLTAHPGPLAVNEASIYDNTGLTNTDLVSDGVNFYNSAAITGNQGTTDVDINTNGAIVGHDVLTVENNPGTVNVDVTGLGADTYNTADIAGNSGSVSTTIDGGSSGELYAEVDNNSGSIVTDLNGNMAAQVLSNFNTGQPDTITVDDPAGATISLDADTDSQTVNLLANGGTDQINVNPAYDNFDSGPVTIDAPLDTSPIYVAVQEGTVGAVTADVGGVTTVIPAGDEYEFVNGAVDIISTSY